MSYVPHSFNETADWISVALCFLAVTVLVLVVGWFLFRSAGCRWPKGVPIESPEKSDAFQLFYWTFVVAILLPAVILLYPKECLIPLSALICGPLVIAYVSIFWSNRCGKRDVDGNQQSADQKLKSRYARRHRLRGNLVCILPVMLGIFATNLIYFYYASLDSSWYRIVLGAYLAVFDFIAIRFLRTLWESANDE